MRVPSLSQVVPAVFLGSLWASLGVARGAGWLSFLLLAIGGSWTQWCLLMVSSDLRESPAFAARLSLSALLGASVALPVAALLLVRTHHRPLGAVTFVFVLAAAAMFAFAFLGRWRAGLKRLPAYFGLGLVVLLALGALGFQGLPFLIEGVAGLILLAVGGSRLSALLPGLGRQWQKSFAALLVLGGFAALVAQGSVQNAAQFGPLTLGLVGLFGG